MDAIFVKFDVGPSESEQLPRTHTSEGRSHEQRAIVAGLRGVEQTTNLLQVKHFVFANGTIRIAGLIFAFEHLTRRNPRAFDRCGRIPDAPIVADSALEDRGGRRQYFVDGLRGKPFPLRRFLGGIRLGDLSKQVIAQSFDLADLNLIYP
ncbi:MAG TPA: hypothetical protein VJX23_10860 [Candidatus Binataceae bacterium]|nr:hypothetical protein [Candidatus Binataceae bacterium]